ncbi:bifunctional 3-deoxy-7-phosphoheptulonate synthase/chorismate mutase [Vallitalea pronyensis]|nr:bifunctional 3-deoxy-7-phosphoheptulonate synthase/chorismate mutase [Vallitalea pronyensis]
MATFKKGKKMGRCIESYRIHHQMNNYFYNIPKPIFIAGPCALENEEMMDKITAYLVDKGIKIIRAGIFKPRTSPYNFQGIGINGLKILNKLRGKYNIKIISEIVDTRHMDILKDYIDIFQVGARNMQNFELLKQIGKTSVPVLLKRGMCSTINEFMNAAEYILCGGNENIMLCERGIRTFETCVRNTLDLSCVAIIKEETNLPIIVDLSHSLGRKDIAIKMAKAALACGSDGIMVEVHQNPTQALSDSKQQMNLLEFDHFINHVHDKD